MIISATEIKNSFGKYLKIAEKEEVIIVKNGVQVARLIGMDKTVSFLSDQLVGIIPKDVDEKAIKNERLSQK
ncbi:MAG: type II toxin-antitoxin system prevent-host-death family antitoxin [Candidatus Symbiothrix sp.]|jgi:prevent-host-death family protein|nr:type II toxin-antitoxin system prevent-host-death family antitoxin [Candidatus Symbiothrix sp.]